MDDINTGTKQKLTASTLLGFRVTIKTTLELVSYLSKDVGFKFLLTRRINQDTLEVNIITHLLL